MSTDTEIKAFLKSGGKIQKIPDGVGVGWTGDQYIPDDEAKAKKTKRIGKDLSYSFLEGEAKPKRYSGA